MSDERFRDEIRSWLQDNFPAGAKAPGANEEDSKLWLERLIEKGWTAPGWPTAYGGGGLNNHDHTILLREMAAIGAGIPAGGMGMGLIGPTLLEFGTEEQKQRHLTRIVRREVRWCQGYSEPGAGSDLASLTTRAEDNGDYFLVNGQKTWTSGANLADWIFALVRTDPDVPKHDGISFVLMDMHQPGITVRPIRLISGASPFCDTFFDDAIAQKEDLVGKLNQGWTVGKRLLQHERSGGLRVTAAGQARKERTGDPMGELAKKYVGEKDGKICDPAVRDMVLKHRMKQRSLQLTQARARAENQSGRVPAETTSIFKLVGSTLTKENADLQTRLMGFKGYGWEGDQFTEAERDATRAWLRSRAVTIYGGTNEVQMNIIAKRVLGLPD